MIGISLFTKAQQTRSSKIDSTMNMVVKSFAFRFTFSDTVYRLLSFSIIFIQLCINIIYFKE